MASRPFCAVCNRDTACFAITGLDGTQLCFADYRPVAPGGPVGDPPGTAWFCDDHLEAARAVQHHSLNAALDVLAERFGPPPDHLYEIPELWIDALNGADRVAVMKVLREGTDASLGEVRASLEQLPSRVWVEDDTRPLDQTLAMKQALLDLGVSIRLELVAR